MNTCSPRALTNGSTEAGRLRALQKLGLVDTPPEQHFDDLASFACAAFDVFEAQVTLVDANYTFVKASASGWAGANVPRPDSFCPHTILQDGFLVVLDATRDTRFRENPYVTGETHIRFYAGFPLLVTNGYKLGSFCLVGTRTRKGFSIEEQALLGRLARQAAEYIEERTQGDDHPAPVEFRGDLAQSETGLVLLSDASSLLHANAKGKSWFEAATAHGDSARRMLRNALDEAGKSRTTASRCVSFDNQSFLVEVWPIGHRFALIVHEVLHVPEKTYETESKESGPHSKLGKNRRAPRFWTLHPTHSS